MDNISLADASLFGDRTRARLMPLLSDAIAAGGGVVVAFGLLLIGINQYANTSSRWPGAAVFAGLAVVAYFALGFAPRSIRPSCIAAFAIAVPACFGFIFFPKVHEFGDLRPFFVLTIGVWIVAWILPRTTARPLFVALALLLFWLWMLGEVAGTGAYSPSASPIPAPPYLTSADFSHRVAQVSIDQLDPSDPLYSTAQDCADGDNASCDELYNEADPGSDFATFGRTCGGRSPDALGGECEESSSFGSSGSSESSGSSGSLPITPRINGLTSRSRDKTTEIGVVSTLIGIVYLGALMLLDRKRYLGLATAFVVPGILALQSGVSALGDRSRHLWIGGLLTLVAGLLIGALGEGAGRRFTTWYGGYTASIGVLLVGLDTANAGVSIRNSAEKAKLIGPGLIIIVFGVALVLLALLVANTMHLSRPGSPPPAAAGGVPVAAGPGPSPAWGTVPAATPGAAPANPPASSWQAPPVAPTAPPASPWQVPPPASPPPASPSGGPAASPSPAWPPRPEPPAPPSAPAAPPPDTPPT